jgi:hypothetical protein
MAWQPVTPLGHAVYEAGPAVQSRVIVLFVLLALASVAAAQRVQVRPATPGMPAPAPAPTGPTTGTGAVSGVVTDATTKQPVPNATVTLARTDSGNFQARRIATDSKGRFVFRDLPAAKTYYLGARRFDYAPTRWGWTGPGQSLAIVDIRTIAITDDRWVNDVVIPLWRLGAVGGRVIDEVGEPVAGVVVRAFGQALVAGQFQAVAGPMATTDDRGLYRLTGLEPGRYSIGVLSVQSTALSATPEAPAAYAVGELEGTAVGGGFGTPVVSGPGIDVDGVHRLVISNFATPPPPESGRPRAYPPLFYPAARTLGEAQPVDVAYGETRAGVDFQLRPVPASRVAGRLDAGGASVSSLLLRLMPIGSERLGFGAEVATTSAEPDGRFTFLNVPAGDYLLLAQSMVMDFASGDVTSRIPDAPGFARTGAGVGSLAGLGTLEFLERDGPDVGRWARHPVSVDARDLDDLVVPMKPTVKVTGDLVYDDGMKPPERNSPWSFGVEPANGDPMLGNGRRAPRAVETDPLAVSMSGLLGGTYLLNAFQSQGTMLKSIIWDGRDVTYSGFDASAGRDFTDVVITITDKTPVVTGTISGRQGAGDVATIVLAFPVDRNRWVNFGWSPRLLKAVTPASDSTFKIANLPEGEYFLIAVPATQADGWLDPTFLAAAAPLATRVSLRWGDVKTQNLSVSAVMR